MKNGRWGRRCSAEGAGPGRGQSPVGQRHPAPAMSRRDNSSVTSGDCA